MQNITIWSGNNVEFIKINTDITDDEWNIIKGIFRSTKQKPVNKFEGIKLYKLLLNNICGEIDIFNKGQNTTNNNIKFYKYTLNTEVINKLFVLITQNTKNLININNELLTKFKINIDTINDNDNDDEEENFINGYLFGKKKN